MLQANGMNHFQGGACSQTSNSSFNMLQSSISKAADKNLQSLGQMLWNPKRILFLAVAHGQIRHQIAWFYWSVVVLRVVTNRSRWQAGRGRSGTLNEGDNLRGGWSICRRVWCSRCFHTHTQRESCFNSFRGRYIDLHWFPAHHKHNLTDPTLNQVCGLKFIRLDLSFWSQNREANPCNVTV